MIIGVCGYRKTGKSTVADILRNQGFVRRRFAEPLKDMLRVVGLTDAHLDGDLKELPSDLLCSKSPRHAMQTLGTEWARDCIHPEFWVKLWYRDVIKMHAGSGPIKILVDDVRFPNEVLAIREAGGVIWRVTRPGYGADDTSSCTRRFPHWLHDPFGMQCRRVHISESYIADIRPDIELMNDGSIVQLQALIARYLAG